MHILLVDDSKFCLSLMTKIIAKELPDARVSTAMDGNSGFAMYSEKRPDAVVLDLLMPGMNGQEVLELIRAHDQTTPVIIHSADVQDRARYALKKIGIQGFVPKPLNQKRAAYLIRLLQQSQQEVGS